MNQSAIQSSYTHNMNLNYFMPAIQRYKQKMFFFAYCIIFQKRHNITRLFYRRPKMTASPPSKFQSRRNRKSLTLPHTLYVQKIFNDILAAQRPGNVSVLVTDLIYSPADTRDVSVEKIFNEENSLATRIFKQYKGKSILVHQLMGDYQGKYYPYNNQPFNYSGQRPFYLLVIADTPVMDAMAANADYSQFMQPAALRNSYRFNQAEATVNYCVVPDWIDNAGRFRIDHRDPTRLTKCEGDKTTGIMCFSIAVDLSNMHKPSQFLAEAANYQLQSTSAFTMKVQPVVQSMITGNNRAYLDGKTHLITLTGKLTEPRDEIIISLANDFPAWIEQSTAQSDVNPSASDFATTTLGLKEFLGGIASAFGTGGKYTTIKLHLER